LLKEIDARPSIEEVSRAIKAVIEQAS
jgi:hypothetical protein